jgi:hypothetical protein
MKMNKLTTVAALALATVSLTSLSASAQNVSASPTDLILGFRVTDGTGLGATTNLEVDLGAETNFTASTANITLNQLVAADLTSTYGANWATRGDLAWGVAGDTTAPGGANSFDVTYSDTTTTPKDASTLTPPFNSIGVLSQGLSATAQTANSTSAGKVDATSANGYTAQITQSPGDYGFFSSTGVTEVNDASGNPVGSDELFGFTQAGGRPAPSATDLGTFSLSSDGALSFTGAAPAAVPEPSAYALGLCAVILFFVLRRRQSVA